MENSENGRLTERKRAMIFINLVVSGIASSTLATAMTTALPDLVEYFHISTDTGQWVTSGYSLAMGTVMPLTAFLITKFPTKRLYAFGTGCFIAGLLLSIFAGNFGIMMLGRVMQACGNGILMSAAQVIILTVYPAERRGSMMGTYGLATTAAPIVAPTVAGLMIDAFGWRSIFWLVMAIMTVSFVVSIMVFENVLELRDKKFDFLSFVESIFAFGGITLGAGNITAYGVVSVQAGLPLLTWGTSNVDPGRVADASSLLTSFRTIAGSIGSAVFVGIMNIVSESSKGAYGGSSLMHGMNVSFLWMTVGALVLLAISIFGTGRRRDRVAE